MYARVGNKSHMVGGVPLRILLVVSLAISLFALSVVAFASPSIQNGSFVIDEWVDSEGSTILSVGQLDEAYATLQDEDPTAVDSVEVSEIPTAQQQDILADFIESHPEITTVIVDLDGSIAPHEAYESLAGMGFASYSIEKVLVGQSQDESGTYSTYAYVFHVQQGQADFPARLMVKLDGNVYVDSLQAYAAYDYTQAAQWPDASVQENSENFSSAVSVAFSYDNQGIYLDGQTVGLGTTKAGDIAWCLTETVFEPVVVASDGDDASGSSGVTLSFSENADDDSISGMPVAQDMSGSGDEAEKPASPARDGYVFAGWYTDTAGSQLWDFNEDVVETDTTLFAKWIEIAQPSSAFIPRASVSDPTAPPPSASTTTLSADGGPSSSAEAIRGETFAVSAPLSLVKSDLPVETGRTRTFEIAESLQQTVETVIGLPASEVVFDDTTASLTALQVWCWVHFYMVSGVAITAAYMVAVVARRMRFSRDLKVMEKSASIEHGRMPYPMGLAFMKDIFSEDTWSR